MVTTGCGRREGREPHGPATSSTIHKPIIASASFVIVRSLGGSYTRSLPTRHSADSPRHRAAQQAAPNAALSCGAGFAFVAPMHRRSLAFAAVLAAAAFALRPDDAHAIVRLQGTAGVLHLGGRNGGTHGLFRLEGTFTALPWMHVGLWAQGLPAFDDSRTGGGGGAMVAFRPALPSLRIDPMGYASLGWLRAGAGNGGLVGELGAGLVYHANAVIDFELRAGAVQVVGSSAATGLSVGVGLALAL